jgi:hypothetical protein
MSEKGDRRRALAEELDRMAAKHPEHSLDRRILEVQARRMRGLAQAADRQMSKPAAVLASPDAGARRIH